MMQELYEYAEEAHRKTPVPNRTNAAAMAKYMGNAEKLNYIMKWRYDPKHLTKNERAALKK